MAVGVYKYWLKEENLIRLQGWRRDGLSYEQIAANMGINAGTLYVWVKKYPEIHEALKKGEEVTIYQVENALYKSAMGYEVTETDQTETVYPDGTKTVTKHARKRHIPPSVGAICFILKNRRSGDDERYLPTDHFLHCSKLRRILNLSPRKMTLVYS